MNPILDKYEDKVVINGVDYEVLTDFKDWLNFKILLDDNPTDEEAITALMYVFTEMPNEPLPDVASALIAFMLNEDPEEKTDEPLLMRDVMESANKKHSKIIDYEYDADYILSAFLQVYGIDLSNTQMHWHKFQALFSGLPDDTKIKQAMSYRSLEPSDLVELSKSEKRRIRSLIDFYKLPDTRTQDELDAEFANSL